MCRLRMMVAASADAVCSVSQKMFLRGLNMRRLPVITLNSFWGFLRCIYRDGSVLKLLKVQCVVVAGFSERGVALLAGCGFGAGHGRGRWNSSLMAKPGMLGRKDADNLG